MRSLYPLEQTVTRKAGRKVDNLFLLLVIVEETAHSMFTQLENSKIGV
jgi:hypothetical protein